MTNVHLPEDFEDFLAELLDAEVEFVVIGGWAVAVHGHGRTTYDLDVLVRASERNAPRVYAALAAFGAPIDAHGVGPTTFATPGTQYLMGLPPRRIDVLTQVAGIAFDDAVAEVVQGRFGSVTAPVIGLNALLENKRAAGRHKDLADVEVLERLRDLGPGKQDPR